PLAKAAPAAFFVKGSVWRGKCYESKPVSLPAATFEIIVNQKEGEKFRAEVYWNGEHVRDVEGTVVGGAIRWGGAAGDVHPGVSNAGKINGKHIDIEYSGRLGNGLVQEGTISLDYVRPDEK